MPRLLDVIERQFSLEILLKNQERKTIEAEKAKVEVSIKQIEQCVIAGGTTIHFPARTLSILCALIVQRVHTMKARTDITTTMVISSSTEDITEVSPQPPPLVRSELRP